ncbi:AMIN domain-containing protein [Helicobacter saguini]|uniref:N-acetylmuramoyl-L-alanine amidase n=1 Tax=Helicobacter saguini TaxID=1548018 RepID=A0A347VW24_9HELI|nr:N-acetylmuramoyl-L-alanine amidase [Helicobacter saguini]MWV62193.1 AMIN domain-containing protein [Helicobacter saguini]MWV67133.1 AMIN domain-containing protein [Helicobacter saguini]MWV69484.1 AMIN domain-containing protein [Helicobacter saguini]MWV70964.1 AMIN domain-containing protein [Helicobacter saguini]TLD92949.1 AMIN domain-containing protein [Helicobacter saguini]
MIKSFFIESILFFCLYSKKHNIIEFFSKNILNFIESILQDSKKILSFKKYKIIESNIIKYIIFLLFLSIISNLNANALKIVGSVPFGSSSLRIEASKNLTKKDISVHKLNETTAFIDISGTWTPKNKKEYNFPNNTQIVIAQNKPGRVRVLITLTAKTEYEHYLKNQYLYIAIKEKTPPKTTQKLSTSKNQAAKTQPQKTDSKPTAKTTPKPATTAPKVAPKPASKKSPSPILVSKAKPPANGRKIVILDPGHGGKDCGTAGVAQMCEKTIVLSVAKLAAAELDKRGYIVYMTRNSDVFIELQRRTEMANEIHADLFISIHANSMPKGTSKQPKGVETYFLSTARSERAVNVAANENQGMATEYSPTMIASFLTSNRIIASNKLGMDVQAGILKQVKTMYNENLDGGVREGPFWVLVGALMPSVLVEIGYNSHPEEAIRLKDSKYQALIAKGIANGIESYVQKNP